MLLRYVCLNRILEITETYRNRILLKNHAKTFSSFAQGRQYGPQGPAVWVRVRFENDNDKG